MEKSNIVEDDDPDLMILIRKMIEDQLKKDNKDYDGSTLILGRK